MLDFSPSPQTPRYAFEPGDKVTIGGIDYQPIEVRDTGYVFTRLDGQGVAESFSRAELARLVDLGRVEHERGALLPESARARLELPADMLSKLPASQHRRARLREAVVLTVQAMEREGTVNRTDTSLNAQMATIKVKAGKLLKAASDFDDRVLESGEDIIPKTSARSVRRWLSAYEDLGLPGLYDRIEMRGYRTGRLCPETLALLSKCVGGYMSRQQPTQAIIYQDVKRAFDKENEGRGGPGRPKLDPPSKETVRQAILALDPYQCMVAREGEEAARRKFAPVGRGLLLTRPLERVEIDTWKVDVMTILAFSGILHFFSDEDKRRLGLAAKKKRWHLTVAICATTRCIVAMRLSRSPSAKATIQTIDMIMRDKGVWSDEVDALSSWHMRGTPSLIVTDCGSEYVSYDARVAAIDLGIRVEHAPAGLPEMRARIERFFRTMSTQLMPRLTGRTFSNIVERGDYDPSGRAALTVDDLCEALVRYVVDIYHRQPHEGLDGESPAACWDRLTAIYGVPAPADLKRRRLAFGTRTTAKVQKDGITIFGVRYHSEAVARHLLRSKDTKVNVRWYAEDLGAIAVEIDGEWIEVPSVFARYRGVSAQTWLAARRSLVARFKHEATLSENIVFQAITDIVALNGKAMKRIALVVDDWSEERLQQEEERLFIGYATEPDIEAESIQQSGFGDDLSSAADLNPPDAPEDTFKSASPVSAPNSKTTRPECSERHPDQGDDEDDLLSFDIEDK